MPGAPIYPSHVSHTQLKSDMLNYFSIAGVSNARINEWRLWQFGPHAEMGLCKAMPTHELRILSLQDEDALTLGAHGRLSRTESKRVAASVINFHDMMDAYANFALITEYLFGPDDPRVCALPRYFMLLRRLDRRGHLRRRRLRLQHPLAVLDRR